jgi:3-oxoacyl-[acyl-carrier protein] reductase
MNLSLSGKTAIICGASQGLGLACAQELAFLGANCILVARQEDKLKKALSSLTQETGQNHQYQVVDFKDAQAVHQLAEKIQSEKKVSILINNTGGPSGGLLQKAAPSEFEEAFRLHVVNFQILAQAAIPIMKMLGYGRIIQIISTSVKAPIPNLGVSNTIRAAVANWAKTLASELAETGITVNNVLPGSFYTERLQYIFESNAADQGINTEVVAEKWRQEIPMKRFGEPAEFAAAVAFLASPAASYITGINLPVDGGKTPGL